MRPKTRAVVVPPSGWHEKYRAPEKAPPKVGPNDPKPASAPFYPSRRI